MSFKHSDHFPAADSSGASERLKIKKLSCVLVLLVMEDNVDFAVKIMTSSYKCLVFYIFYSGAV